MSQKYLIDGYGRRTARNPDYVAPLAGKASRVGFAAALLFIIAVITLMTSCGTVAQDEVGFAVGGGVIDPDKNKVTSDLIEPGRHIIGIADGMWTFPANRTVRFQDFKLAVTTVDGKTATLEGQMDFRFVGEKDPKLAREFAEGIGSRKYAGKKIGDSDEGLGNFLDQLVTPEINASLKDGFGRVYCADFEPSCRSIDPRENVPVTAPEDVYDSISTSLQERVDTKLGGNYLQNIRIRVAKISLPGEVQSNIDQVTAEQAKTKKAEQSEQTATAEAKAIRTKGKALKENRDLIALEVAKECKGGGCTIIVDAANGSTGVSVPAGK